MLPESIKKGVHRHPVVIFKLKLFKLVKRGENVFVSVAIDAQ